MGLQVRFIKLQLLRHGTGPGEDDDEAFVAFMVRFKFRNQAGQRQGGTRVEQITERRLASVSFLSAPEDSF